MPKRYATVYIDGVKMSDPSTSDNSFYISNIMKHAIERVEILKGSQSSLYGSSAIGGTINIFTKKGREGKHYNYDILRGSWSLLVRDSCRLKLGTRKDNKKRGPFRIIRNWVKTKDYKDKYNKKFFDHHNSFLY